jgi:site-specific DNA-methyltransferase (adenine-specific)
LFSTNETFRELVSSLSRDQLKLLDATFGRDGMMGWGFGSGFPKSRNIWKTDIQEEVERQLRAQGVKGEIQWK